MWVRTILIFSFRFACRQVKIIVPDIHEMVIVSLQYDEHLTVDPHVDMFLLNTPCLQTTGNKRKQR